MHKYRRIIQLSFFLAMFFVPIINILEIYFIRGTYISLDVGLLSISDPLAILQALFASHEFVAIMLVSAFIPTLVAMLFGTVWCSWACPYYLILDFFDFIKRVLHLKTRKPKYTKSISMRATFFRFAFLVVGLGFVGITGVPFLYLFSPPSVISTQVLLMVKYFTLTFEILLILTWFVLDFVLGYRIWCRYFCPTGTLLSLFKNRRTMRVEYAGACSNCMQCVSACPLVIDPRNATHEIACNNCGVCIDVCNCRTDKALKFRVK